MRSIFVRLSADKTRTSGVALDAAVLVLSVLALDFWQREKFLFSGIKNILLLRIKRLEGCL